MIINIPEKLRFVFEPSRYKVAYGGRGSGKTMAFAKAAVLRAYQQKTRILCTRELQKSIKDSVMNVIKSEIETLGLTNAFEVGETFIRGSNGSEFVFTGLRNNYTEVKGMHDVDIAWLEEAENTSPESLDVLLPTIRKPNSEIWVSFNPRHEWDAIYKRFVIAAPEGARVVKVNWRDNPWFDETELPAERLHDMRTQPEHIYRWKWEGECLTEGDMAFFTVEEVKDAMACTNAYMADRCIIGCDPSMGLNDGTAFAWRYGDYVDKVDRFLGMDEMACANQIVQYMNISRVERVVIDTMVGNAIRGRLLEQGYKNVIGINFGGGDLDQNYANNRAAMYGALRRKMREGVPFRLPNDFELLEELTAIRWKPTANGRTALEPKEKIIERISRSPDKADALALSFTPTVEHVIFNTRRVTTERSKSIRRLYG